MYLLVNGSYRRWVNDAYDLLAKPAAAQLLGISIRTLDRIRLRGEIVWERIGGQVRFDPLEIDRYREAQRRYVRPPGADEAASIKEMFPIPEIDLTRPEPELEAA